MRRAIITVNGKVQKVRYRSKVKGDCRWAWNCRRSGESGGRLCLDICRSGRRCSERVHHKTKDEKINYCHRLTLINTEKKSVPCKSAS